MRRPLWLGIPPLDGELLTDPASLQQAANDFGHIVHRTPRAVLRPGSVDDIVTMVRFCNRHLIPVAARGQGHSTFGQPQVEDGLVIDMSTLSTVHHVGADQRSGRRGDSLELRCSRQRWLKGKAPPVLTDYLELSVGGTLTVGGIGGTTFRHGFQVDNVLALEVVTGEGRLVTCSPRRNRDLFEAVLAGLGQCALIVRATVRLVRATELARIYLLAYSDLATFTSDQRRLIADGRFDYVEGQVVPDPAGGWSFLLETATFFTPPRFPDDDLLLDGLRFDDGGRQEPDLSYSGFQNRLALLPSIPGWTTDPHPWINLFLPASVVDDYVSDVLVDFKPGMSTDRYCSTRSGRDALPGPCCRFPTSGSSSCWRCCVRPRHCRRFQASRRCCSRTENCTSRRGMWAASSIRSAPSRSGGPTGATTSAISGTDWSRLNGGTTRTGS